MSQDIYMTYYNEMCLYSELPLIQPPYCQTEMFLEYEVAIYVYHKM